MKQYIMALDAGTSSVRALLLDKECNTIASAQKEIMQFHPEPSWVEQDPSEIWSAMLGVAVEAMQKRNVDAEQIAAIGITNQRETTILWDANTGEAIYPAIGWQCKRSTSYCDALERDGYADIIREKTGLVLDAYFSATKCMWILDHVEGARDKAKKGQILFGTVDTWLLWKLSGGKLHITDYSNASRTMFFNIHSLDWDEELLQKMRIPRAMLPEVKETSGVYGLTAERYFHGAIPLASAIGDQQAALFGQCCFAQGEAKNTYGTGAFLLMNTGLTPKRSKNGLITTIAWSLDGRIIYALEGSIFIAGSAIRWLRDGLRILDAADDSAYMASKVSDTNDTYVVPAFTGLGAPYWDPDARGCIVGITGGTNKYHLIRATLESIAYLSADVLAAMEEDAGVPLRLLRVDGGASDNDFLMQFQADMLQTDVARPNNVETTALGAAYMAGLAVGFWKDTSEIQALRSSDTRFGPQMESEERSRKMERWHKAVRYSRGWANPENRMR